MKSDIAIIIFTAIVTSGLSTLFSYYKEKKFASSKYTQKVLEELYIPIYKILESKLHRHLGYVGINYFQLIEIKELTKEKIELCDPKLEKLIRELEVEFTDTYLHYKHSEEYDEDVSFEEEFFLDENLNFRRYILYSFNKTRKSLGLPTDTSYLYPPIFKTKAAISKIKYHMIRKRKMEKIKKRISELKK